MLEHHPIQDQHGTWHAAYQIAPGLYTAVVECPSEAVAVREAARLDREQQVKLAAALRAVEPPQARRIPRGFYTDSDAA